MDNIKSLMDRKQYDLVTKLTRHSTDQTELFYRVSALVALNKPIEALKVIESNKNILEKNILILSKIHIEILCLLSRFDEAYLQIDYYKQLPYQSQKVEELLSSLPDYVKKEEKRYRDAIDKSPERIIKLLHSSKDNDLIVALTFLKEGLYNIDYFIKDIKDIILKYPNKSIRNLYLMKLAESKYNKEVKIKSNDEVKIVIPSSLFLPFVEDNFVKIMKRIQSEWKDPSLASIAQTLLSNFIVDIYPESINSFEEETLLEVIKTLCFEYMNQEYDSPKKDEETFKSLKEMVSKSLE